MSKRHEIFQINAQHGDMAFMTGLRHEPCDDDGKQVSRKRQVKYEVKFDVNERSRWEHKDTLYENYDKDKTYKL